MYTYIYIFELQRIYMNIPFGLICMCRRATLTFWVGFRVSGILWLRAVPHAILFYGTFMKTHQKAVRIKCLNLAP